MGSKNHNKRIVQREDHLATQEQFLMTSELLEEVKKYSAQMNQNAEHAEDDQLT